MEIIVAKNSSFCKGVSNSINKTQILLTEEPNLYCLGELVHNQEVIDELNKQGLKIIDNIDNINNSSVIIRAHGIQKKIYEQLEKQNNHYYDLTCPKVLKIHHLAEKLKDDNYVILIGIKKHPEVIGTISYCGFNSSIIENEDDIINLNIDLDKVAIIVQTTFSLTKFQELVQLIKKRYPDKEIKVYNTICDTTRIRQEEVAELAKKVDCMLIVGGKNSSNTHKLYDISQAIVKTFLIENTSDLNEEVYHYDTIGIIGGASTPMKTINNIINYLKNSEK